MYTGKMVVLLMFFSETLLNAMIHCIMFYMLSEVSVIAILYLFRVQHV